MLSQDFSLVLKRLCYMVLKSLDMENCGPFFLVGALSGVKDT